ncbi:glutathione S-transferase family protein [Alkalimarinus alittae]|uniref:Glutathione S-transferase family protein n=1 Tax=Alkalimarinus alittae TaxID=2961619 RepID=A0ABY6N692_9ALTE|nr:glutathione S-transferase family protein [Alkalimarinus alittae]UZE97524.1 glutathione S-transferase family protein [Alkalimarinus alittae]
MITVYGYPKTRTNRVTWMLEELGVDYKYHFVDLMKGEGLSKSYRAINPSGKVPSLADDDLILTESAAILTYLGDKYGAAPLLPKPGSALRGTHDQWLCFAISELEQPLWTIGKHKFALPKERRVVEVFETAAWEFQKALALLSAGLGNKDYILGADFSAADILIGHTLFWGMSFKQPIEQENLVAYINRLKNRPARLSAIEKEEQAATSQ